MAHCTNCIPCPSAGEGQEGVSVSFSELRQRVATLAAAMRGCGIGEGDRVVGYLPNSSFAVEAMLATASIGAVWSSTSPDFGVSVSLFFAFDLSSLRATESRL